MGSTKIDFAGETARLAEEVEANVAWANLCRELHGMVAQHHHGDKGGRKQPLGDGG